VRLLNLKTVSERTGIPLGTLRFYIRTGQSPFNFRHLPSGKIVISEEELKHGIDILPEHTKKRRSDGPEKKPEKAKYPAESA
jgi:hypothetical protein